MSTAEKIEVIKRHIRSYPDFPRKNVLFRDIFSVLQQPDIFSMLRDAILEHVRSLKVDVVIGLESRGFLFGPLVALDLHKPFVPIRKKGKLPGKVHRESYALEYGEDSFEIQEDVFKPGDRILLIDDLLATGGSLSASCKLVKDMGGVVVECFVIIELADLKGRDRVAEHVHSLIQY